MDIFFRENFWNQEMKKKKKKSKEDFWFMKYYISTKHSSWFSYKSLTFVQKKKESKFLFTID